MAATSSPTRRLPELKKSASSDRLKTEDAREHREFIEACRNASMLPKMSAELKNVFLSFDKLHLLTTKQGEVIPEAEEDQEAATVLPPAKVNNARKISWRGILPEDSYLLSNRPYALFDYEQREIHAKKLQMQSYQPNERDFPSFRKIENTKFDSKQLKLQQYSPKTRKLLQRSNDLQARIRALPGNIKQNYGANRPTASYDDMTFAHYEAFKLDIAAGGTPLTRPNSDTMGDSGKRDDWRLAAITTRKEVDAFNQRAGELTEGDADDEGERGMLDIPRRRRAYTII